MNQRSVWQRWRANDQSTAEIARRMDLPECDVDRVIAKCMDARALKLPMPWDEAA